MKTPDYLTIQNYYDLKGKPASTVNELIHICEIVTGTPKDEILTWEKKEVETFVNAVIDLFGGKEPTFYPIFDFKDVTYGFQPLSKMTLGEWADLETYAKDYEGNLHKIMAIIYRPITKHNWKNPIWKAKHNLKLWQSKVVSPFETYDVEDYNIETYNDRVELFKELPAEIAKGAMVFFLSLGLKYSNHTLTSSLQLSPQVKAKMLLMEQQMLKQYQ